jgi:hypothetical protein
MSSPASTGPAADAVDFAALDARLNQNSMQERLTSQWIRRCRALVAPGE